MVSQRHHPHKGLHQQSLSDRPGRCGKKNMASPRLTRWVSSPPKVLQPKCESTVQPSSPQMAQRSQVSGPSPLQGPSSTAITKLEKVACSTDEFLPELLKHLVSMEALLLPRSGSGCDTQTHRNPLISLMKVKCKNNGGTGLAHVQRSDCSKAHPEMRHSASNCL